MTLEIITANTSHAEIISTIGKISFIHAYENSFNKKEDLQQYVDHTFNLAKILKSIGKENNVYFLAFINDIPAAFAKVKRHSLNEEINGYVQMELQKIYVLPEYHDSDAACVLLHTVMELAQQMQPDYLWLEAHESNTGSISLYEKNGFEIIHRHHFIIGTQTFKYHVMALPVAVLHQSLVNV